MESGMPNIAAGVSSLSLSLSLSVFSFAITPVAPTMHPRLTQFSHETPYPITTCVEQKISQLICCSPAPGSNQKEEATTGSIVVECETAY